jgi:hypothetical protein
MSILAGLGAVPVKLTVPLTEAAVAGSMGVAGAWVVVAACSSAALDYSVLFLLQPRDSHRPSKQSSPSIAVHFLLVIMSPHGRIWKTCCREVVYARSFFSTRAFSCKDAQKRMPIRQQNHLF